MDNDGPATPPRELEQYRLRMLRDQAAELMQTLDELGLHEAAAHVSMSLLSIDRAAARPAAPLQGSVH